VKLQGVPAYSVSICRSYTSKLYTHHTQAPPDLGRPKKKNQGMYALFPYTHHTHSLSHHSSKENKTLNILYVFTQCEALSTSKYQPSFTSTSVSICRSYISKSYTHHTWASRLRTSQEKTSRYVCSFYLYTP
jgi:hypothetical protein